MTARDIKDSIGWGAVSADIRQQVMDLCDVVAEQGADIRELQRIVADLAERAGMPCKW